MFAKVIDGVVVQSPWTWDDMRKENPEVLFPNAYIESVLEAYGGVKVVTTTKPEDNHLQSAKQETPQFIDGVLTQVWTVITATESEVAQRTQEKSDEVRSTRNDLLVKSDYTQVTDFDANVDKAAWAVYRQALRDVTTQSGFPWSIDWPVAP
jgi:Phage tail assembly chaperone protein